MNYLIKLQQVLEIALTHNNKQLELDVLKAKQEYLKRFNNDNN